MRGVPRLPGRVEGLPALRVIGAAAGACCLRALRGRLELISCVSFPPVGALRSAFPRVLLGLCPSDRDDALFFSLVYELFGSGFWFTLLWLGQWEGSASVALRLCIVICLLRLFRFRVIFAFYWVTWLLRRPLPH